MRLLYTIKRLAVVQFFVAVCYWFPGCGIQQPSNQFFDVAGLLTTFPACFSMQASVHCMGFGPTFRCRVVCCVSYNQRIDFIVKGPLGIEIIHGCIDKKGVTIVDRLRRIVHQWDYQRITQHYHFVCNYPLIQSLLLGTGPIGQGALPADLAYTYDDLTRNVIAVQLRDTKQFNIFTFLYRYKMVVDRACLSGIKLRFLLKGQVQCYQGRITLYKLYFKKLKKPNIRLAIPTYYRITHPHL
ncbi:DUF4292 domain-containing protein [Candidatus Cardinium sp. TP]|uniref:DUF4292 domain-containing protein n=1 Tax=Candidatus Cardinium sp. TP TaxID=2961955 RepID=UPI0021AE908F|nr:DUF4292 domain-containing protein [Candidatus Cardinium sp. TP]MCT4697250.1 DUF4292 domain-containing protein [Candidatus Cardinium sp. TP]MDN5247231.1 DUF4292 domain-containing protein [Candidatus Cardinium sp.]